jgi:hypothetical protein
MRFTRGVSAAVLIAGLASPALAEQQFLTQLAEQQLPAQPPVTLTLEVEDAMLIVQTLGQIGCQNVQQLTACNRAAALLLKIKDQVKAQGK